MKKRNKGKFVAILLTVITIMAVGSTFCYHKIEQEGLLQGHTHEHHQHEHEHQEEDELVVVTSFYPMYIAALNIFDGLEHIHLENLSEPESGCLHDYQLTPEDMKILAKADVFIINGGGMETFMEDAIAAYPELKIIDTTASVEEVKENSHTWMSISLYRKQIAEIAKEMTRLDLEHGSYYQENADIYDKKLEKLQQKQEEIAKKQKGNSVVLLHEGFEFFAKDLGLETVYLLNLDEERQVSPKEVAQLLEEIEEHHTSYLMVDPIYGIKTAELVETKTNINIIKVSTLVRGEMEKDSYEKAMEENLSQIEGEEHEEN